MDHIHKWVNLGPAVIEVRRSLKSNSRVQSVYQIVKICDEEGCSAGMTRDGILIADVTVGVRIYGEGMVSTTSPLKWKGKEK